MPLNGYWGRHCDSYYEVNDTRDEIPCPCNNSDCTADWYVMPKHLRSRHQNLSAFIYYEAADGSVMPASATHEEVPSGYARREAQTITEMRALERRMNRQELDKRERWIESEQAMAEYAQSQARAELRQRMQSMSQLGQDFARHAMEKNNHRQTHYDRRVDPGIHIHLLHNNERKA